MRMCGAVFGICKGISDELEVKFGVHQGSVLSSLLFITMLDYLLREIRSFQQIWNRDSLSAFTKNRVITPDNLRHAHVIY